MAFPNVNCTSWPMLQPNPDVSGIGVVVSFLLSAYSTLILVGIHFLISPNAPDKPLDRALRTFLLPKRLRARYSNSLERWNEAIEYTILAFSDTQLVTSLAILISGYLQLPCGISLYHWQTVVDLAWFSALTHLSTLTSLRQHSLSYPVAATCRILVMGIVLVLLSLAFVPTGYAWQRDADAIQDDVDPAKDLYAYFMSSPAACLLSPSSKDVVIHQVDFLTEGSKYYGYYNGSYQYNTSLVVLSLIYLLSSYATRVIRMSVSLASVCERWLKITPMYFLQCRYQSVRTRDHMRCNDPLRFSYKALLLTTLTLAEACYDTANSMIWEIMWLAIALAWGTLRLIGLRTQSQIADENQWGFGQVLPLVVSILPIWWLFTLSCSPKKPPANALRSKTRNIKPFSTMRKIKKTTWFRSLTCLVTGMVTVLAAYVLFDLPGAVVSDWSYGIDILMTGTGLGYMLVKYAFALTFCIAVCTIFVLVCLIVHFRKMKGSKPANTYPVALKARAKKELHGGLWCAIIVAILALQVAFIVIMLIYPAWLLRAIRY